MIKIELCVPVDATFAPPYALANCYEAGGAFKHRVTFQFLSGTVSYVLRSVYNYFVGITYDYEGLLLKPCMPKEFGDVEVEFTYLGKKFRVNFKCTEGESNKVVFNGQEWNKTKFVEENGKAYPFFEDKDLNSSNELTIEYWCDNLIK